MSEEAKRRVRSSLESVKRAGRCPECKLWPLWPGIPYLRTKDHWVPVYNAEGEEVAQSFGYSIDYAVSAHQDEWAWPLETRWIEKKRKQEAQRRSTDERKRAPRAGGARPGDEQAGAPSGASPGDPRAKGARRSGRAPAGGEEPARPAKPSKFKNRWVTIDGLKFQSAREGKRWLELTELQRTGEITELERQVRIPLVVNGVKVCTYIADFKFTARGVETFEDTKGYKTPVYRLKKRLLKAILGIDLNES